MIIILIKLIAAHLLGDFLLQTDKLCEMKRSPAIGRRLYALFIHSGVQAGLSYLLLAMWSLWMVPVIIFVCHFLIDFVKGGCGGTRLPSFIADQIAHYMVIAGLWVWLVSGGFVGSGGVGLSLAFWALLTSYIAVLAPSSILIKLFMEYEGWAPSQSQDLDVHTHQEAESLQGLPNAGKWIGYLERVLILTFIYTGNVEGIGFLLAAKSVFRFGELNRARDIKVTEYVLIGTFLSFTIAIVIGFGVKWLLGMY